MMSHDSSVVNGVFTKATTDNAILVLKEVIAKHGRPASILTDHGFPILCKSSRIQKKRCITL